MAGSSRVILPQIYRRTREERLYHRGLDPVLSSEFLGSSNGFFLVTLVPAREPMWVAGGKEPSGGPRG